MADDPHHSILKKSQSDAKLGSGALEVKHGSSSILASRSSLKQEVSIELEPPKRRRSKVNFLDDNQAIDEIASVTEAIPHILINDTPEMKIKESHPKSPSIVIPLPIQEEKEPETAKVNTANADQLLIPTPVNVKQSSTLQVPLTPTSGKPENKNSQDTSAQPRISFLSGISPFFRGPSALSVSEPYSPKNQSSWEPNIKRSVEMLNDSRPQSPEVKPDDKKSEMSNGSSLNSKYPTAREINESFGKKLWRLNLTVFSLVYCVGLGYFFFWLSEGLRIPIEQVITQTAFSVIIEVALLAANYLVAASLNCAISAYFGYCLTRKTGYSLAVCGYTQAKISHKHQFAKELSQNSACRQILLRLRWFWLVLELLTVITPIVAVSMTADVLYMDDGYGNCLVYTQYGFPEDRLFPNFDYTAGVASHVFGQALGSMRAEELQKGITDSVYSTFIMGPQLLDAASDGQSIVGQGYSTQWQSNCYCININDPDDMQYVGVNGSDFTYFQSTYLNTNPSKTLITQIVQSNSTLELKSVLTGFEAVCGGNQYLNVAPVCSTTLSNFNFAVVQVQMMTDGTSSSGTWFS
ncbi:hypothetical protein HK103_005303 [Boothiomyces macroporosus]|uniref:Uncharacterized protein n=1 Tax=Boothiomyces macroporosus TaxID=261099 RepID=A0AAD5UIC4_9FUNG|nr:hypothetical protein HK103_005303 [Boothiomyces macroporosus]